MRHDYQDRVSLVMARRVADELSRRPELIDFARANLDRWSLLNANAPGLMRCYDEWRGLLGRSIPEVITILTAESDEGERLRQNSPFAGILTPQEV